MLSAILLNKRIAADIYDMRLQLPAGLPAVPGAFLHIDTGGGSVLRRPISLCGYEKADGVARIVYAVRGEGTRRLSRMTPGRHIDVLGPLGRGFTLEADKPTLLVGGGIGVPPMVFCDSLLGKTHALLGFRGAEQVILAEAFGSYELFTDDGSAGIKGYPHERLRELLAEGGWERVLACGPKVMLRAVAEVCQQAGIDCQVSMEERMACGVGACRVCACAVGSENKRVCMDGPVFNAKEVDWS